MILIADSDAEFRSWAADVLDQRDRTIVTDSLDDVEAATAAPLSDVALVIAGPNLDPAESLRSLARIYDRAPEIGLILVSSSEDGGLMKTAMRAGVRDVLTVPVSDDELVQAVKRAEDLARALRRRGSEREETTPTRGRVITVFSTKGGCGKSLLASNVAILLAERTQQKIALVDLDLQSGDQAIMLQLLPALSVYDASTNIDRLDVEALRGYLTPHRAGIHVLAAPLEPSVAEAVTPDAVSRILELLRESYPYTIVDGPALFTDQVLAAFDVTDDLVLVTSMDVPSIKNLKLALTTAQQLGFPRERIKVVLNRADSKVGLRVSEVEKTLGTPIDAALPSSREVPLSVNQGIPLALQRRKSPVVLAIDGLVTSLVPTPQEEPDGRRTVFDRFLRDKD